MARFGEIRNGASIPEDQAKFLKKYGHRLGMIDFLNGGMDIYYSFENAGFIVTEFDGKAVQVRKIPEADARLIIECQKLKFGEK